MSNKKKINAQNLIEFIFILPILLFLTLVIFEVALFWQDVNAIYNVNAEINANVALIDHSGMNIGDRCSAATEAIKILKKRDDAISLTDNLTYNDEVAIDDTDLIQDGSEPFALYNYKSSTKKNDSTKPIISLWVDCRNPFEDGVVTQLEFYHKTLIIKATIPRFDDGDPIEVIPENIFIASPKLNTLRQY